jgi:gliding motility-associated-like protein
MLLMLVSFIGKSQGLVINEFANDGSNEWVELLVIGNSTSPTSNVDLTGWIIDDNGGNFEGSISGVGLAGGHIKLTSSFNSVPPGSLIVIYSEGNKSAAIPTDDPTDTNNDSVYILPGDHSSLEVCTSLPVIGTFSYSCSPSSSSAWSYIGMRGGGDAVQTRSPLNVLFHGFSYGDVTAPFPLFSSSVSSWNIGSGASGLAYAFTCGDWEVKANFNEINEPVSTPGAPNNANNTIFITRLKNGSFDYSNRATNCNPLTVVTPPTTPPVIYPDVEIPNVFSPNEDNENDVFTIRFLFDRPKKELTVYNRWGLVVYESTSYTNNWDGKHTNGNLLAEGVYFYVLDIGEKENKTGSVTLFR